ncbi:MAG: toprim domain-containing protein [Solirubrobacteraceae bacterium]
MNRTLPGADVRGFYAALGVELPGWAHTEAPVRCFADPDAHAHGDRDASCSVNLQSGAFNCHGCGAKGGAFDAALARGRDSRQAFELKVAHGLAEREPRRDTSRATSPASTRDTSPRPAGREGAPRRLASARPREAGAASLAVGGASANATAPARSGHKQSRRTAGPDDEPSRGDTVSSVSAHDVRRWAQALRADAELLTRLAGERGWKPDTLRRLGVGFDGERITVPITNDQRALQGVLRLRVDASQRPKVLAAPGTRLGLTPHPSIETGRVLLVEGPSDMLAARSAGLAAIAVPGTHAWRAAWAGAFAGREVTIVMDADRPGRDAAARIARDLDRQSAGVRIVDLAPGRDDGYDLSDWLKAGNPPDLVSARWYTSEAYTRIARPGADVWTVRSASGERAAGERSQQAVRTVGGPITQPGAVAGPGWQTGRKIRCRTF